MKPCACKSHSSVATNPTAVQTGGNQTSLIYISQYKIPKMDCAAEEQLIRLALAPIQDVVQLQFDLRQHLLEVQHTGSLAEITAMLEKLALGATLQQSQQLQPTSTPARHNPDQQRHVLWTLLGVNAALFLIEFIMGIIASSTGLMADALDMFADAAVYGMALYAVGKAQLYQLRAAQVSGWLQIILALSVLIDVIRRFFWGSEPDATFMMLVSLLALLANTYCLYLISGHKEDGVHMTASWIFSSNDVIVNIGVIVAGVLVYYTHSAYPDLIVGSIVTVLVFLGARKILSLQ